MEIKLTTKNMAYMAMFAAMQVVLEYCTKFYEMPKGGNCAFSLVAIILCGYLMNWGYSLIVSLVCLGLHFTLGLATFYGPLSVIFDYLLPMVLIGLTPLIPLLKVGKYTCWNYRNGWFKNDLSFDFRMVCFPNTITSKLNL